MVDKIRVEIQPVDIGLYLIHDDAGATAKSGTDFEQCILIGESKWLRHFQDMLFAAWAVKSFSPDKLNQLLPGRRPVGGVGRRAFLCLRAG